MQLLPYTPIEYLMSPGAQYIDSGICPDHTTGTMCIYRAESRAGLYNYPCGAIDDNGRFYGPGITANTGNLGFGWGSAARSFTGASAGYNPLIRAEVRLNFMNDGRACFTNAEISFQEALVNEEFYINMPIHIFGANNRGSNVTNYDMRIYEARISRGSDLLRHFVPALDAAGIPCMWDKVSQSFFYNQGTGSFLAP